MPFPSTVVDSAVNADVTSTSSSSLDSTNNPLQPLINGPASIIKPPKDVENAIKKLEHKFNKTEIGAEISRDEMGSFDRELDRDEFAPFYGAGLASSSSSSSNSLHENSLKQNGGAAGSIENKSPLSSKHPLHPIHSGDESPEDHVARITARLKQHRKFDRHHMTTLRELLIWNRELEPLDRKAKFCMMQMSPFRFFRGANHVFFRDFALLKEFSPLLRKRAHDVWIQVCLDTGWGADF